MKVRISLVGLVFLCVFRFGSAEGADLRYIRIGEHKAYTRIVFEFRGAATFKEPVAQAKGRFSVVFENTTTALPEQIASETSKRVDSIAFVQEKSHLTANVSVTFPYFEIKSFSLSKPDRVVLDVTPLSTPPQGVVFEERLDRASAPKPVAAVPEPLPVQPKTEAKVEARSSPGQTTATEVSQTANSKGLQPTTPVSAPPPPAEPIQTVSKETPVAVHEPPKTQPIEEAGSPAAPGVVSPLPDQSRGGGVQTTLLIVLLGLSVVIVGLLAVIVFRKKQVVERKDALFEMPDDRQDSMAAIDAKLKKALNKIG